MLDPIFPISVLASSVVLPVAGYSVLMWRKRVVVPVSVVLSVVIGHVMWGLAEPDFDPGPGVNLYPLTIFLFLMLLLLVVSMTLIFAWGFRKL